MQVGDGNESKIIVLTPVDNQIFIFDFETKVKPRQLNLPLKVTSNQPQSNIYHCKIFCPFVWLSRSQLMMASSMETFPALPALCANNSPVTGEFPTKAITQSFNVFLICAWDNNWANTGEAGDLRRHRADCEVIVVLIWELELERKKYSTEFSFAYCTIAVSKITKSSGDPY